MRAQFGKKGANLFGGRDAESGERLRELRISGRHGP